MGINPFGLNWGLYQLMNDFPGKPKEVKCVGCKLAMGASSFGLGSLLMLVGKKKSVKNIYIGMIFGIAGASAMLTSGFFFRTAYEHKKYNELLMRDMKKKQIENFENIRKEKQQIA